MANNQALLYDSYMDYYKRATEAQKTGNNSAARKYFVLAAETLQQLALISTGDLKKARYATVKKLLLVAESIKEERVSAGGTTKEVPKFEFEDDSDEYELEVANPNDKVLFDDIIGLEKAKEAIHRKLIYPLANPEVYKQYNLKIGGNILLEGPPGTGKTTFAKAAACEIKLPFIIVSCNSLVDSLIGNTGKNIDKLFSEVRRLIKNRKTPVIMFCDEFDAIAKSRSSDDKTASEAVPTLIRQLDGFSTSNDNITLIAATNLKDSLDKAILSRFSSSIYIPLPDLDERFKIFESKLKKSKVRPEDYTQIDFDVLAASSDGLSGRDINNIVLDFLNILAQRDSGITAMTKSCTDVMLEFIENRGE